MHLCHRLEMVFLNKVGNLPFTDHIFDLPLLRSNYRIC